ncbi:hypothetical protein O3W52_01850 [Ensifer psoraleae]|uniref:Uncharacterized protein n=1 Tax=Sinorhizobium psoraleae TaxID=520838 RepID=A0ABT4KA67_9HYPH|nr:hypothetical protein [Sinorhizobium psoraleae]
MHAGVPTALIGDFGAYDDYGLHYFYGSGLIRTFAELDFPFEGMANADWRSRYVGDPNQTVEHLAEEAVRLARVRTSADD